MKKIKIRTFPKSTFSVLSGTASLKCAQNPKIASIHNGYTSNKFSTSFFEHPQHIHNARTNLTQDISQIGITFVVQQAADE
jgi:hypothetical protein